MDATDTCAPRRSLGRDVEPARGDMRPETAVLPSEATLPRGMKAHPTGRTPEPPLGRGRRSRRYPPTPAPADGPATGTALGCANSEPYPSSYSSSRSPRAAAAARAVAAV